MTIHQAKPAGLLKSILVRVLPVAVALLALGSLVVSNYVGQTIRQEAQLRLVASTDRATQLIAQRLDLQRDYAAALAANELLINSLVDGQERDRYLPLFFRSLKTPGVATAQIALTDYRGRVLASNAQVNSFEGSDWFTEIMRGQDQLVVANDSLLVAAPLIYGGSTEGAIVLRYSLSEAKALLEVAVSGYEIAVLSNSGTVLSALSDRFPQNLLSAAPNASDAWVSHRSTNDRYPGLQVVALQATKQANMRVEETYSYLLVASLLSILALIAGTLLTVRMATKPLTSLLNVIETTRDASDLSAQLEVQGPAEFRSLAIAFNEMLERLEHATISRDRLEELNEQLRSQTVITEATNRKLEHSNEELKQFAYIASHDLQEPLRKVTSFCQLLHDEHGEKLDDDAKTYIQFAVDGAQRMRALITDLLDYSRVETQGKPLELTDAESACRVAIETLQLSIEECAAKILVKPLPSILADHDQLVRLFQNLLGNAIKYHSNRIPEIVVDAQEKSGDWIFSVQDNGIGIEPQYQQRIFAMFQRLHPRDEYMGTGIGLPICKRIVERVLGRIWVESEPGVGSTFYFSVPNSTGMPREGAAIL